MNFLDFSNCKNLKKEYEIQSTELFEKDFNFRDNELYYFAIYKIDKKKYAILLNIYHIIDNEWFIIFIQKQICDI